MIKTLSIRTGVILLAMAGLPACSNMMGSSGTATRSTAMAQPPVSTDMVKQVQSKLHDTGYYKQGPVDGVWGAGTETAVASFQRDRSTTRRSIPIRRSTPPTLRPRIPRRADAKRRTTTVGIIYTLPDRRRRDFSTMLIEHRI
jgi:peptidoglycan hydrolase-like protein with peptidoglycan-binding domain